MRSSLFKFRAITGARKVYWLSFFKIHFPYLPYSANPSSSDTATVNISLKYQNGDKF